MTFDIFIADTEAEIQACFPVFSELRLYLKQEQFLAQVRRQQLQSYQILAVRQQGAVKSVAGFRLAEFLAWGKILYVDDLATLSGETAQGFAGALLGWLIAHAKAHGCQGVHLDSGHQRFTAHRLYLNKGFQLSSHYFSLSFNT
ncbi:GNAT family N-acetyltransferase [Methylomonas fluvii]|uniref:GNAT family N-acetyltransferase n=1 Tax=Methylomonas fluvii TaxID=1854564 RepID=A0ABR9DJG2_9GAMM|nr:GNAT family N-acetyltransferase [Methylomonas fluvii]MBD9363070.1 GNAT family N-acetyltransferase [Methylomonas fluvii]